jgi:hypothetical protein
MHRPRTAPATARTPISAEARGQLRLLKAQLTKQNARLEEMSCSGSLRQFAKKLVLRNSVLGRSRVLKQLRNELGAGAYFERAILDGPRPIALWVYFAPLAGFPSPDDPGLGQECVAAQYLLVGALPDGTGFDSNSWTIVFPDHALGRLFDRWRQADLIATMREAHRNLLKARMAEVMSHFLGAATRTSTRKFYLPASRGVFLCQLLGTLTRDRREQMLVFARTWLDDLDLRDSQLPIAVDAADGEATMGDSFLLPLPLRRITQVVEDGGIRLTATAFRKVL